MLLQLEYFQEKKSNPKYSKLKHAFLSQIRLNYYSSYMIFLVLLRTHLPQRLFHSLKELIDYWLCHYRFSLSREGSPT